MVDNALHFESDPVATTMEQWILYGGGGGGVEAICPSSIGSIRFEFFFLTFAYD